MKVKIKIILVLLIVSSAICILVNHTIRPDYIEDYLNSDLSVNTDILVEGFIEDTEIMDVDFAQYVNPIRDFDELLNSSDIVVEATLVDREQLGKVFNTKIHVDALYKGEVKTEDIYVYEPVFIRTETNNMIARGGYLPLVKNKKYILFLRKENIYEKEQYNLTSIYYGKYPTQHIVRSENLEYGKEYSYGKIKDNDILSISVNQLKNEEESMDMLNAIKNYEKYRDEDYDKMFLRVLNYVKNQGK